MELFSQSMPIFSSVAEPHSRSAHNSHARAMVHYTVVLLVVWVSYAAHIDWDASTVTTIYSNSGLDQRMFAFDDDGSIVFTDNRLHQIFRLLANGTLVFIAGSSYGFSNGVGAAAAFRAPWGIAVGDSGTIYVGDLQNYCIRSIQDQSVTTAAGTCVSNGWNDGGAATAKFGDVRGVAWDGSNYLYIADIGNQVIRRFDAIAATVSTVAGTVGTRGSTDGPVASARFNIPSDIVIDATSNCLYVADTENDRIRRISLSSGMVDTIAGTSRGYRDGGATSEAQLFKPYSVSSDPSGVVVYILDTDNCRVRLLNLTNNMVTTISGFPGCGGRIFSDGNQGTFSNPYCVRHHSSVSSNAVTLIVADLGFHRFRHVRSGVSLPQSPSPMHKPRTLEGQAAESGCPSSDTEVIVTLKVVNQPSSGRAAIVYHRFRVCTSEITDWVQAVKVLLVEAGFPGVKRMEAPGGDDTTRHTEPGSFEVSGAGAAEWYTLLYRDANRQSIHIASARQWKAFLRSCANPSGGKGVSSAALTLSMHRGKNTQRSYLEDKDGKRWTDGESLII